MAQDAVHILFEGSKYFGNTKTLFHIALVEHTSHDVIEVVSYDKRHSVEAPSLYLSYSALLIRINDNAVSQRVQDLREEAEERDMVADENKILKIAVGEAMFDFLSSRLFASAAGANKAKLEFKLLQKDLISLPGQNPLRNKPEELEPFSYDSGLISDGKGLSCKQKWCIPNMLAKVAKSRSLLQREGKAPSESCLPTADADANATCPAPFNAVTRTNSDTGSQEGFPSPKSHRGTLSLVPSLTAAESTALATEDEVLPQQLKAQRQGSISAGYDVMIASLQRGLSMVHSMSFKSSKVAVTACESNAGNSARLGSAKFLPGAALISSAGSVGSAESEGSAKDREESRVDPWLAGLSPCERANFELRASRYVATVAANAAAGRRTSVARPDLRVDTVAGPAGGAAKSGLASSPSVRLQQAAESLRNGMEGLLHPMRRMLNAVTRRSISAIAAEE